MRKNIRNTRLDPGRVTTGTISAVKYEDVFKKLKSHF